MDNDKALALYRQQGAHRFHAGSGDAEVNDPVKVFNIYGYTTCGNGSICMAAFWRHAGLGVRPAYAVGHVVNQVYFDGEWHLIDADNQAYYLKRDNHTIASGYDVAGDPYPGAHCPGQSSWQ